MYLTWKSWFSGFWQYVVALEIRLWSILCSRYCQVWFPRDLLKNEGLLIYIKVLFAPLYIFLLPACNTNTMTLFHLGDNILSMEGHTTNGTAGSPKKIGFLLTSWKCQATLYCLPPDFILFERKINSYPN